MSPASGEHHALERAQRDVGARGGGGERGCVRLRSQGRRHFTARKKTEADATGGNGVVAISGSGNYTSPSFGQIGSTRDAPYDPRQIQLALKLYF